jgi:dipeptidyl aminopeptidase/acylaminoacyl peptidase
MRIQEMLPIFWGALFFLFVQITPSHSQQPLSLEEIMMGEYFIGHLPQNIRWSADSKKLYYDKKWTNHSDSISTYEISIRDTSTALVNEKMILSADNQVVDHISHDLLLYSSDGDLFIYSALEDSTKRLSQNLAPLTPLRFAQDGQSFYYLDNGNIFLWHFKNGFIRQLTDFRKGDEPKEKKPDPSEQWLMDQQMELFDITRTKSGHHKLKESKKKNKSVVSVYTGKKNLRDTDISPDGRYVFYTLTESQNGKPTQVPDYMDPSGYVSQIPSRAKVGTRHFNSESYIYDRHNGLIIKIRTNNLTGIRQKPSYLKEYHKEENEFNSLYEEDRPVTVHKPRFNSSGLAVVEVSSSDHKDRWIALLNCETGELEEIDRQRDEAWIGGPAIQSSHLGWIGEENKLWFLSEVSGFSHIYIYDGDKKSVYPLTQGKFEILSASLSKDAKTFYVTANAEGPHEQHFYHIDISTGSLNKITRQKGGHEVFMSPDEKHLAIRYSFSNKPWELYIMENRPDAPWVRLTSSTTPRFDSYSWKSPEIVWFMASDGVRVPARLYTPKASVKNGAAVIFVHGAGYLQNVHHWWSSYHREYMFHHFLTERGYTVLDIDYRASRGYGRDWRTAIYRHMGGRDLQDHIEGAEYLIKNHKINKRKIGIYGGSYGGFITLMAMFTSPSTFRSGAALRAVTDWAHYNHGYTSRILNTPVSDPLAYQKSSPIYFAEGLQNDLLILHGMVDVNVQFQDVVRLSQKLIELKKDKWEMAVFPAEDHGFRYNESWLDEYKRIWALFEKTLR